MCNVSLQIGKNKFVPQLFILVEEFTFHEDNIYTDLYMPDVCHKQYKIIILRYTDNHQELDFADI